MSLSGKFISNFSSLHRFACCVATIFIIFITNTGYCQSERTKPHIGNTSVDSAAVSADTIKLNGGIPVDTTGVDSVAVTDSARRKSLEESMGIRISPDALPAIVKADARDSAVLDMEHDVFYLYGKANVKYEDMELSAGQVNYTQATSVVTAAPNDVVKDTGTDRPSFKQGTEKFTYDSMQYNFKSKRAIVRNVNSKYGEGYVHSEQVKRNPDQSIYGSRSIYTTCALDTPHFGIWAKKIKVIPGRVIVSGPANLNIEGVPTPLYLPFGIFPVSTKQKSGFILPTYTLEQQRGFGLINGGYYFYINDNVDLFTQANLYTKGSYALSGISDYNRLYHYRGALRMSYAYNKTGEDFEPNSSITKGFMVNWTHNSDDKAVPGQSFRASVEAGSSTFYSQNSYDPNQVLKNQYQSNITYAKNWMNHPFGLTISALHNQNTQSKQINVTLPSMNFYVNQFNPFQSKNAVGSHWYDKISTSYSMDLQNRTTFYDSTLNLADLSLSNFQNGIKHSVPVSASYTILRYLFMSFSVNYNEYWLSNRIYQQYNDATEKLDSVNSNGFYATRDFSAGVDFNTRIYGMKMFKNGSLRGIRHVLRPNIGLSYRPDFAKAPFNYYYRSRPNANIDSIYMSPYPTSVVGGPPQGKSATMSFGLENNLQIKVRSVKDTVAGFKNVILIDGLGLGTSYNAAADSFNWSDLTVNFRTSVLGKINITSSAVYSAYAFDYDQGHRLNKLMIDQGTGVGRFRTARTSAGTNFHSKPKGGAKNPTNSEEYARVMRNAGYNEYVDFNIPWSLNVSYSLDVTRQYTAFSHRDTTVLNHTLTFNGELQVTERWRLVFSSGYNFDEKALTQTSIDVYRDLHCWQMHFQTYPFGPRKFFNFTLNVKSTVLQDLKLVRRRDFRDVPN
jgi:lipopolysaccharide assembly outer membrane protein LptD (OstA)